MFFSLAFFAGFSGVAVAGENNDARSLSVPPALTHHSILLLLSRPWREQEKGCCCDMRERERLALISYVQMKHISNP